MTKKTIRAFASQFGKEWQCSCKAPFKMANLEVVSESENSLVAHYTCPKCGREQMLAASISNDHQHNVEMPLLASSQLTADDVLDIRDEVRVMKQAAIRTLQRRTSKKERQDQPSS